MNSNVFFKPLEKAATNETKSIITLTALHPSIIKAINLPFNIISSHGFCELF